MDKIEAERARRVEAETLREVLEAINRQARLQDTIDEVLKQLSRIVVFDSCRLALLEPDGRFRILAVRGVDEPKSLVGEVYRDALSDEIRETRWPVSVTDVEADERLSAVQTLAGVRSWAGIPLLVEGEVIGLLSLDRWRVEPFSEEDLQHARAVAFSAGAAIRKAQLLAQVRRYATLMEQVVAVDQAVFGARPLDDVLRLILQGALRTGSYPQGLLLVRQPEGLRVAAAHGAQAAAFLGRALAAEPVAPGLQRLGPEQASALGLPAAPLLVVPLPAPEPPGGGAPAPMGLLVLFDVDGESPDDRLMEAYASRAATAYLYATEPKA
jgi:hypothetical protein